MDGSEHPSRKEDFKFHGRKTNYRFERDRGFLTDKKEKQTIPRRRRIFARPPPRGDGDGRARDGVDGARTPDPGGGAPVQRGGDWN